MRIERIRIDGFGALTGVDLDWPDGRLLLVLDQNEEGKSTLCEAIVAALYGLPRGRARAKDLRRPRSGAPLRVGLDLVADGVRWSVDRDLEDGTLRVVDRERGVDVTRDFLRSGGRDVFGERVTGLTEQLFRSTGYVPQNRLDEDALDSTLTIELARIADSGGGEASVVRALRALQDVRAKMPDAVSGPSVSVETEIIRLARKLAERETDVERVAAAREGSARASAHLSRLASAGEKKERLARRAELAVVETERRVLVARLEEIRASRSVKAALEEEASALARDAELFGGEALTEADRQREERGSRPEALAAAAAELEAEEKKAKQEARDVVRRFGPLAALGHEERVRLHGLLAAVVESAAESAIAEEALEAQWEELQKEGLAADLKRLDALAAEDRELLAGAEEERRALEIEGVQLDRKAADASAAAGIAAGERRERIKRAKGLVVVAGVLVPLGLYLALPRPRVPLPVVSAVLVFIAALLAFGGVAWLRGRKHRVEDEETSRAEDARFRNEAVQVRRQLSDLRKSLERIARSAGFGDSAALVKAHRRARAAEEKRRILLERRVRRDAVVERRGALAREIDAHRDALSCPVGLPSVEDAQRTIAILEDLERLRRAAEAQAAVRATEAERIAREDEALRDLERRLRTSLERLGVPRRLSLPEALLVVESGRRRAARRREIVDVELPARATVAHEGEGDELPARLAALEEELARRSAELGISRTEIQPCATPEDARRAAEDARAEARVAEEARLGAERELAQRVREGGERAREAEEARAEARAALARATLFRDALDLARDALQAAASSTYGDFRRGLAEASRAILAAWNVPYEALEFADDLSVSVVGKGGRLATRAELDAGFSTGAREQIHLTARLAALRYLGVGARGVPLLLDDPLVGADDSRFASVMRFLCEQVLAERPVLLASCHLWRHQRLLEELPKELRDRLRVVSLAALRDARGASDPTAA